MESIMQEDRDDTTTQVMISLQDKEGKRTFVEASFPLNALTDVLSRKGSHAAGSALLAILKDTCQVALGTREAGSITYCVH
jgi:hypothetical protein